MQVVARMPRGKTGADGKIRLCDLHHGEYRLTATASPADGTTLFGTMLITVVDRDVRDVRVAASPGLELPGQVAWGGEPPKNPVDARVAILVDPLNRNRVSGETLSARATIPGEFSFPSLPVDAYTVRFLNLPRELYVKDVTYSGRSVMLEPLRVGSAIGPAELRVAIGQDGGFVSARVGDEDGKPVPEAYIRLMPAGVRSEPELASVLVSGQTDQNGSYNSNALAPGKYFVLASEAMVDATPESIGKLWRARLKAREIVIEPGKTVAVSLEPVRME
jgi:hypothetical protein